MRWKTKQEAYALTVESLASATQPPRFKLSGCGRKAWKMHARLAFERGRSCTFLFWMFKFWQTPTFRPIKIQEGKKEKNWTSFQRRKKGNKHTHSCKNKIPPPPKPLGKCFWALKNRRGLECQWDTGRGMTIKRGISTSVRACTS